MIIKSYKAIPFYRLLFYICSVVVVAQFCWGVYLGDKYREPILKVERFFLGSAPPPLKRKTAKEIAASSEDNGSKVALRPRVTEVAPSIAVTDRIPNAKPIFYEERRSKRSDNAEAPLRTASIPVNENAPPIPIQPEYPYEKIDAPARYVQPTASPPSTVAQPSAVPHPSPDLVSMRNSQLSNTTVANAAVPSVADRFDSNAAADANFSPTVSIQALQGSPPEVRRIKVMVDEAYVDTHPNWISEVMRTIGELSKIYRLEFGIQFELIGVVSWSDVFPYMGDSELLFNLYHHATEGADIVLGFINRSVAVETHEKALSESREQPLHAFGLVGVDSRFNLVFLPSALRSLGIIYGAKNVVDTSSEAYRLGSWMSQTTVRSDRPLWIDLTNKRRILEHKVRFETAAINGAL